jgi:hypothetical protein
MMVNVLSAAVKPYSPITARFEWVSPTLLRWQECALLAFEVA